jgi:integrase
VRNIFWTGNGKLDTAKADWSEKMLALYRAAGIDERSHAFRDTLVTRALGSGKARMETASALIGHTKVQITQKKYEYWDLERQQLLDVGLEAAWEAMDLA